MRRLIGLLVAMLITVAACGDGEGGMILPSDPDAPVLQIRSESGFFPMEQTTSWGPSYTLLAGGRLIFEAPVIMIYPGPLLSNTHVITLTAEQMGVIRGIVAQIGLPGMVSERDDSASESVADAGTEVITYWDVNGAHTYSVYALGLHPNPGPPTAAAAALVDELSTASFSGQSEPYVGDRVQVIAGVSQFAPEPGIEDIRPWPLQGEDPGRWNRLDSGQSCKVFPPATIETFRDATQATQWLHPDPMMDAPTFALLVRYLHPGEPDCP